MTRTRATRWWAGAAVAVAAAACRPDAGTPDYSNVPQLVGSGDDAGMRDPQGSDPYVPGEARLSVGIFYEGGFSQQIILNGVDTNYFIFDAPAGSGVNSYEQTSDEDRVEGASSDRITLLGRPFWAGGIIYDNPRDLSQWRTMHVAVKSADTAFQQFEIVMENPGGNAAVSATAYGYVNDGEWHDLSIPLSDFAGIDLTQVRSPFILRGMSDDSGSELLVDDLYYLAE